MAGLLMGVGAALGVFSAGSGSWGLGVVVAVALMGGGYGLYEKRRQDAALRRS